MNELKVFENTSFGSVRTIEIDGEIWFVAKDVLMALDYEENYKPARAMQAIPEEWIRVQPMHTNKGQRNTLMISEQGLYFFLGRSDKPKALPFQKWVAGDVIVSIRKTGSYGVFADMLPKNFPEALRALAQSEEEKEILKIERDEAIKTKAWISSSREASIMGKYGQAKQKIARQEAKIRGFENELGRGETFKTIKAIPWLREEFVISRTMYQQVGKELTKICNEYGFPIKKILTSEYENGINTYHVDAIAILRKNLEEDVVLLHKYRKKLI